MGSNPGEGNKIVFLLWCRSSGIAIEEQEEVRINLLQFGLNMAPSTNIVCVILCVIKRNIDLRWSEKRDFPLWEVHIKKKYVKRWP